MNKLKFIKKEVIKIKTKDMFEKEAIVIFIDVEESSQYINNYKITYLLCFQDFIEELNNNFINATAEEIYNYMNDYNLFTSEDICLDDLLNKYKNLFNGFELHPLLNSYFDTNFWEDARNTINPIFGNYINYFFEEISIINTVNQLIIEKYYKEDYLNKYEKYYILKEKELLENIIDEPRKKNKI